MTDSDDVSARTTLRIAGVFQEIRDSWIRRLDSYFNQIDSLLEGQWLDSQDVAGIIRESRMASHEAMDGLGNDLSSELVHASNGIITRYEAERASLQEEINDLRQSLTRLLSGDANAVRRENEMLRETLLTIPEFGLLENIRKNGRVSYDQLMEMTDLGKTKLRKLVKELVSRGFVGIDKKAKPNSIMFISAPWGAHKRQVQETLETNQAEILLPDRIPSIKERPS